MGMVVTKARKQLSQTSVSGTLFGAVTGGSFMSHANTHHIGKHGKHGPSGKQGGGRDSQSQSMSGFEHSQSSKLFRQTSQLEGVRGAVIDGGRGSGIDGGKTSSFAQLFARSQSVRK